MAIKRISRDGRLDKIAWVTTVAYLMLTTVLSAETYGAIVLLGCAAFIVCLYSVKNKGIIRFRVGVFHIQWLLFAAYILISALWSLDFDKTISQAITSIELLLCTSMIYIYYQDIEDEWQLYSAIKWAGIVVCLYTFLDVGVNSIALVLISGTRLEVGFANINVVGMLAGYSIVISLYEMLFRNFKVVNLLQCIPCAVIIAASGTRKALLIVLAGCCILLYYRYKSKNILKTGIRMLIIAIIGIVAASIILSLPMFSGIMDRMKTMLFVITGEGNADNSTLVRSDMIVLGLEQFLRTPIFGIGIGASGEYLSETLGRSTYFHNNFVELLCCGGIVGFLLYYSMFANCFSCLWRNRAAADPLAVLGLTMITIFLTMDMARVSYYSKNTIFYLMIFFLHVKNLDKTAKTYENEKNN